MSAFVEHDFERGFLLDEARLRKLHELIQARLSKLPVPCSVTFKVYRGDSYSYESPLVEDVANEDNEDWRAIKRLELLAQSKDTFDFKLSFSGNCPSLKIAGDDRDTVFLLFSDVREYIKNEVLAGTVMDKDFSRLLGMTLVVMAMLVWILMTLSGIRPDEQQAKEALASSDISAKIDFMLRERVRSSTGTTLWIGLPLILLTMILATTDALGVAWRAVFPTNIFLFGKRKSRFDARRRLMSNIFWVVIVGVLVSAIAGLLVWWGTRDAT